MQFNTFIFSLLSIFSWSVLAGADTAHQEKLLPAESTVTSQKRSDEAAKHKVIIGLLLAGANGPDDLLKGQDFDYIISYLNTYKAIVDVDLEICRQKSLGLKKHLTPSHKAFLFNAAGWNIKAMRSQVNRRDHFKSIAKVKKNERLEAAINNDEQSEEFKSFLTFGTIMALWITAINYAPEYIGHENMGYVIGGAPCCLVALGMAKTFGFFTNDAWEQVAATDVKNIQHDALEIRNLIGSLETQMHRTAE